MIDKLGLKSYAKINLFLDVVAKYQNGYHGVEMVMQTINLYDSLFFEKKEAGISIHCQHSGVPEGRKNLIYQAVELMQDEFDLKGGLEIRLEKNIPVAAGLAGGSSNAAATLRAVNQLWDLGLATAQLETYGAKLGSDVPFSLAGGTQLATGRGTELEKLPFSPNLNLVVVNPPFEVSTAEIYKNFSLSQVEEHPKVDKLLQALKDSKKQEILVNLENLLELVSINRYPKIEEIKEIVAKQTKKTLMSGSGPTVLGFVNSSKEAKLAVQKLKERLPSDYKIVEAATIDTGIKTI